MPITDRTPTLFFATFLFFAMTAISHAQQWNGPANPNGTIWRPGNIAVGEQGPRGDDPRAMVEVTRPLAMAGESDDRLFSANMVYKGDTSPRFEVDTRRAYAGGARSKAGILAADLDFAVHRKAAIGVVNLTERFPSDYMLVVGGKILAEEVRIKLIKDWADHVFTTDYRLKTSAGGRTIHSYVIITCRKSPAPPKSRRTVSAWAQMQAKLLTQDRRAHPLSDRTEQDY